MTQIDSRILTMKPLVLPSPVPVSPFSLRHPSPRRASPRFPTTALLSLHSETIVADDAASRAEYKPGAFDDLFLNLFRSRMVKEVGWDSEKPGYDGLIEVARRLMMEGSNNSDIRDASVRILRSLFPPFLLELYQLLVAPIGEGKLAAMMVARVTALTCQWLMGKCTVNSVDLPDGTSCQSGVFVERCKYLEESRCVGICVNTCKLPTQSFFKDYMGVPLLMEPNFEDYSCQAVLMGNSQFHESGATCIIFFRRGLQFKFGIHPPRPQEDAALKEPCMAICPNAIRRREVMQDTELVQCPKA